MTTDSEIFDIFTFPLNGQEFMCGAELNRLSPEEKEAAYATYRKIREIGQEKTLHGMPDSVAITAHIVQPDTSLPADIHFEDIEAEIEKMNVAF